MRTATPSERLLPQPCDRVPLGEWTQDPVLLGLVVSRIVERSGMQVGFLVPEIRNLSLLDIAGRKEPGAGQALVLPGMDPGGRDRASILSMLFSGPGAERELGGQLAACRRHDIRTTLRGDPDYPWRLARIPSPPPVLYLRGLDWRWIEEDARNILRLSVALVGTRTPTAYGLEVARRLGKDLAAAGVTVVSGLARGIDACAHQAALDWGGLTVSVLACGLDRVYPPENAGLQKRILEKGCSLSEWSPGAVPHRGRFPARNRIISGLSDVVAVLEASERSGTMITVEWANEQGKDVMAVPGNITSSRSRGTNAMILDGTPPLTETRDLLDRLETIARLRAAAEGGPGMARPHAVRRTGTTEGDGKREGRGGRRKVPKGPDGELLRLYDSLRGQECGLPRILERSGIPVERLMPLLGGLELEGLVTRRHGCYWFEPDPRRWDPARIEALLTQEPEI